MEWVIWYLLAGLVIACLTWYANNKQSGVVEREAPEWWIGMILIGPLMVIFGLIIGTWSGIAGLWRNGFRR